jgi:LPS-assembly lipoprotein
MNNKIIYIFYLGLLLTMTVSCGFHLRGNVALPEIYHKIFIVDNGSNDISPLLKQTFIDNQVQLVDSPQAASSIVVINSQNLQRRAVAVRGKEVKEYEIFLNISISVQEPDGKQRGEAQTISTQRRYSYNNDQVLGSDNEEQILIKEMNRDISRQVLRRLSKIK